MRTFVRRLVRMVKGKSPGHSNPAAYVYEKGCTSVISTLFLKDNHK